MLKKFKKNLIRINWKDITKRCIKTFVQAFISSISVETLIVISDFNTIKTVLLSTVLAGTSAGICAIWNIILEMINSINEVETN